ncbi:hypothetical protein GOODEAATRI_015923 [Goodea atripinnis]|uniref:tRNA-uridine aminocarboxypropyltransferase 1 n=1 Tax=Goodea atripinnis TaxID=208336 RepID=A0ABV0MIH4_9TELE
MSSLDRHHPLYSSCRDKPAVTVDSSDVHELGEKPLQGLKLASQAVLDTAQQRGRLKCSKCGGSRMFFCYTCCSLVGVNTQDIPVIKVNGKSTAVHAKILAPNDVTMYTYPCIPEYEKDEVVLVFPGPGSVSVQDMIQCLRDRSNNGSVDPFDEPCVKRLKSEVQTPTHTAKDPQSGTPDEAKSSESRVNPLRRVVFIDSTWNQTNKISTDERLQGSRQRLRLCRFFNYSDT